MKGKMENSENDGLAGQILDVIHEADTIRKHIIEISQRLDATIDKLVETYRKERKKEQDNR